MTRKTKSPWRDALPILAAGLAILALALFGSAWVNAHPVKELPEIYLISISRLSLHDADVWLVQYAMDGRGEMVQIPVNRDPEAYLAYLAKVGRVSGRK